jgi:hypothetical protein
VFSIRVKEPQTTAERCWNLAQGVLSPIVVVTLIVLKLTGVITWSWWWVLSPIWIGGILLVLGVCALIIGLRWQARRRARVWVDQLGPDWLREFVAGKLTLGEGGQASGRVDE